MLEVLIYKFLKLNFLQVIPYSKNLEKLIEKRIDGKLYLSSYFDGSMWVCPVHRMGQTIFNGGIYEPTIIKIIQVFSSTGFSFVDIGANIGLHTVAAAFKRQNENQKFFAFEPEPECFSILERNCEFNNLSFVKCQQIGIGNIEELIQLNISNTSNKGNHSFIVRDETNPGERIKVLTLDKLFLSDYSKPSTPILIKIDVEGFELLVIKGGSRWLYQLDEVVIICEISPLFLKGFGQGVEDIIECLNKMGFTQNRVIKDQETFTETGKSLKPFFNMIFWKGNESEKVFSKINTHYFINLENVL